MADNLFATGRRLTTGVTTYAPGCAIVGPVPRWLRRCFYALVALLGISIVVFGAWAIDVRSHEGKVLRKVTLASRPIGDLDEARLRTVVAQVAAELPTRPVEVQAPEGGFTTEASALGVVVAEEATIDAALRVGRTGGLGTRLLDWLRSFTTERRAPVQIAVDDRAVFATVAEKDPGPRTPPKEPSITYAKGTLGAVEGEDGEGIDARDIIEALPKAAVDGGSIVVEVDRGEVPPRFSLEEAERLAKEVQAKVVAPLTVTAAGTKATVPVATQRSWVRSRATDEGLAPSVDDEAALADLRKLLEDAGEPAVETRFTVDDGAVRIIAGRNGTRCCDPKAVDFVAFAMFDDAKTPPPELPMTEREPDLTVAEAEKLGVVTPIASFTTRYPAGQPRVHNIHRIADLLRGTVIQPGRTFSVNDTVGRRTAEKGFVSAGVIEEGRFTEDIGGGISQFATTLFNAAFEAGLDFDEYQSHSIYISRYPYGREATLSFPAPDLAIENTSPHGVLIWPTYTASTITVTIYSTKFAEVRQTGQSEAPRGACKRVTTERTRTYLADGRTEVDKVFATYRPAEGVNC
jgi:vancomycin resistance protein YoaR